MHSSSLNPVYGPSVCLGVWEFGSTRAICKHNNNNNASVITYLLQKSICSVNQVHVSSSHVLSSPTPSYQCSPLLASCSSCITFKTLMLVHKAKNGPVTPSYLTALLTPHTTPCSLCSALSTALGSLGGGTDFTWILNT